MTKDESAFGYSSAPHPVKPNNRKFREEKTFDSMNIMADPRIVRGNTHAIARKIATLNTITKQQDSQTNLQTLFKSRSTAESMQPSYEYIVSSSVKEEIDIMSKLIERDAVARATTTNICQTDAFQARPPSPQYLPRKTGIDRFTQVEDVAELFTFDAEVAPILEVIVSKTIEQAISEVNYEETIKFLQAKQGEHHEFKKAENKWMKARIEESEEEFQRMQIELRQKEAEYEAVMRTRTIVAGRELMKQIVPDILQELFNELFLSKQWKDPNKEAARAHTIHHCVEDAKKMQSSLEAAKVVLDELLSRVATLYDMGSSA